MKTKTDYVNNFLNSDQCYIEESRYWMTVLDRLVIDYKHFLYTAQKEILEKEFDSYASLQYHTVEDYMTEITDDWKPPFSEKQIILYMAGVGVLSNILNDFWDYLHGIIIDTKETEEDEEEEDITDSSVDEVRNIWNQVQQSQLLKKKELSFQDRLNSWMAYASKHFVSGADLDKIRDDWSKTL